MSRLSSTIHLKRTDKKTWLMLLLGGCLLALALSRGFIQAAAGIPAEFEIAARYTSGQENGFLPMLEASYSPSLPAETSKVTGRSTDQLIELTALIKEAETMVSLPDGHAVPANQVPLRIVIPGLDIDAQVVTASLGTTQFDGGLVYQWLAPDFNAAGWHYNSALLGEHGNTVINGHHNAYGEVFRELVNLEVGDVVILQSNSSDYIYVVDAVLIFREKYASAEVRRQNALWIGPTTDERLTLVTCWPYESNSYRLLVVARPYTNAAPSGLQDSP